LRRAQRVNAHLDVQETLAPPCQARAESFFAHWCARLNRHETRMNQGVRRKSAYRVCYDGVTASMVETVRPGRDIPGRQVVLWE